jgi:hypothetical protein
VIRGQVQMRNYACLLSANFFSKAVMVRYDAVSTSELSTTSPGRDQDKNNR